MIITSARPSGWSFLACASLLLSLSPLLCLSVIGCSGGSCPPLLHDDIYPLDLSVDAGPPPDATGDGAVPTDATTNADAVAPDGATAGGGTATDGATASRDATAPDGATPSTPDRVNCGSLAEGCVTGQSCPAACDCVLTRQRTGLSSITIIDQCILVDSAGKPSVEIRSHIDAHCS